MIDLLIFLAILGMGGFLVYKLLGIVKKVVVFSIAVFIAYVLLKMLLL